MEFRVLGPLEVRVHDRPLPLGGTRPRVVLAALLLARNTVVPVDRLTAAIWGENPPGTPTAQIQAAVSALRKTLGADRIVTRTPGYLVRVERGELDLDEFDHEVTAARRAREEGDLDRAADGLRAALEWWRDDALVDLAELPIRSSTVAVDERRRVALEERIDVDLALRRHPDLVPELAALVTEQPLRDRLWAQLMRAQYRCGRRADALETYRRARQVMHDELGLEPAAELAAVHEAILADDPVLDPDVLPLGPAPGWVRPPCPFRALEPYQPGDAEIFHGRSAEVSAVVERARAGRVTVVGPSGSGKSSLVLAGVLPALTGCTPLIVRPSDQGRVDLALAAAAVRLLPPDDRPADLETWAARSVDGGLDELLARVLAHTGGERLVVVLDQAEELLTQDGMVVDRVATALAEADADRLSVVATLRADFLAAVLERPALSALLGHAVFALGAMGPAQLRQAVTAPIAGLPGVTFQTGLVERILDDVGSEPGALALLGVTLTLLWDEQVDGTLTHEAYDDLGRVPGALATHAEGEWRRRNLAGEEPVLRRLLGHLVEARAGAVTRRSASRGELDDATWRLAERLSATRLLVVTGDAGAGRAVELAHEALITHWPRLHGWIERDGEFHLWRSALRGDLERWQQAGKDPALLVRGTVLAAARRWSADHDDRLGPDEIDFVRLSQRHQHTAGRRSRLLRSGLAAAAVLVLVLGLVFAQQRTRTAAATAEADSRALAARSVAAAADDPRYAALMAVAAYDRAPTDEALSALFARYRDTGGLERLYPAQDVEPGFAEASTDGRVIAVGNTDRTEVTVWTSREGRVDRVRRPLLDVSNAEVAADGSAVWLLDRDGIARLDPASGTTRTVVPLAWSRNPQLALSPDGGRILLRDRADDPASYRVRQWSTGDGRLMSTTTVANPDPRTRASLRAGPSPAWALVEFRTSSPDDYRAEQLDLATGARTVVAAGSSGATAGNLSAVVTCTVQGDDAVLTGTRADHTSLGRVALHTPGAACPVFVVGPDGRVVVKQSLGDVRVVDLTTGAEATVNAFSTSGRLSGPFPAMVTQDGARLLMTGPSWVGVAGLSAPEQVTPVLRDAEVLDDGRGLVGISADGSTLVVRPTVADGPGASVSRPSAYVGEVPVGLQVGHGGVVADRVAENRIALHRLPGLEPLATVNLPVGGLTAMYLDEADRLVTVIDQRVSWWNVRTGTLQHHLDLVGSSGLQPAADRPESPFTVTPTPEPNLIAVTERGRPDITLRDVGDGQVVDTLPVGGDVDLVRFQRSSSFVLVSRPTVTEVWDTRTRQRAFGPLPVTDGALRVAAMTSRPGQLLTLDLAAGRWHVHTYQVGDPDPSTSLDLGAGADPGSMSADGTVLSLDGPDGTSSEVLRLDPATWRGQVCAALRDADLSADDRAAHPDAPDGPVCAINQASPLGAR